MHTDPNANNPPGSYFSMFTNQCFIKCDGEYKLKIQYDKDLLKKKEKFEKKMSTQLLYKEMRKDDNKIQRSNTKTVQSNCRNNWKEVLHNTKTIQVQSTQVRGEKTHNQQFNNKNKGVVHPRGSLQSKKTIQR